jgi:hypothetical protein
MVVVVVVVVVVVIGKSVARSERADSRRSYCNFSIGMNRPLSTWRKIRRPDREASLSLSLSPSLSFRR